MCSAECTGDFKINQVFRPGDPIYCYCARARILDLLNNEIVNRSQGCIKIEVSYREWQKLQDEKFSLCFDRY